MNTVKESIIVAFAFVGVVVGAGFATGQEIFQFLQAMAFIVLLAYDYWSDCDFRRNICFKHWLPPKISKSF